MNGIQERPTKSAVAVAYLRSATAEHPQCRRHLKRQLRRCEAYAHELGISISTVYVDLGVSGLDEQRPGLMRLLRELPDRHIRYVTAASLAPVARNAQYALSVERQIGHSGATLIIDDDSN